MDLPLLLTEILVCSDKKTQQNAETVGSVGEEITVAITPSALIFNPGMRVDVTVKELRRRATEDCPIAFHVVSNALIPRSDTTTPCLNIQLIEHVVTA